jgi:hypothetical protein
VKGLAELPENCAQSVLTAKRWCSGRERVALPRHHNRQWLYFTDHALTGKGIRNAGVCIRIECHQGVRVAL